ncbi:MAG: type II toxin-antitoxin system prevent-host-death family antitoxin [Acetobacteraceae bacterium]|nr:type II toxin-antitoxin system prevent-host-death family antitoxin [Acetobacteraceae bacterium]
MATTVGAFEAKTHLSALLDRVERGEEITITRRGRAVARLVAPAPPPRDVAAIEAAVEKLRALRDSIPQESSWEEWKRLRDEGRR